VTSARPLVLWDGECSFCRAWVERGRQVIGERVEWATYQEAGHRAPSVPREQFARAVHLVEPGGRITRGAEAVFRALALVPGRGLALWLYRDLPGFAPVSEACYAWIAAHRPFADRVTRTLWGRHVVPPGERLTSWILLRALGVTFLIAFVSLWTQAMGLIGHDGILPAADLLNAIRSRYGPERMWLLPTLAWLGVSDTALHLLFGAGTAFSLWLAVGIAPAWSAFACWALYLSLSGITREFCWFQWDALLLEAGLLAVFLAPWRWWSRPADDPAPSRLALWALRALLFKLFVSSAVVKITSGDPNWRHLTALEYHYQTQCLPPWTAWYFHHLPPALQKLSAAMMFSIEGLVPFLIVAPRRLRFAAAFMMIGLQAMIAASGNYGFFNLLSIVLCIPLFDDAAWPWRWRRTESAPPGLAPPSSAPRRPAPDAGRWPAWLLRPALAVLLVASLSEMVLTLGFSPPWLMPLRAVDGALSPLRSVNSYGLFRVMTTKRDEIVLEASDDGVAWRELEFRWKPGDVRKRPAFVAPHQPRLDWQMWFAALGDYRSQPWFFAFCQKLLAGSPSVRALMAPRPDMETLAAPPRYLRALLYDYRFSDAATRRATGAWWVRKPEGLYCPVMMLSGGQLAPAPPGVGDLVPQVSR
jgi:predicted DCC family thiol-disulfide oxidoreductase YuxK